MKRSQQLEALMLDSPAASVAALAGSQAICELLEIIEEKLTAIEAAVVKPEPKRPAKKLLGRR